MAMKAIYKISNPEGQIYIGQTKNFKNRVKSYKSRLGKSHRKLHASFLKYGFKAHSFEVLHELPTDSEQCISDSYERLYIEQYKECGFEMLNIREGGIHGKPAEETRAIWSSQRTGRKMTETHKQKLISINKGKPNCNKGKKFPHQKEIRREGKSIGMYHIYRYGNLIGKYRSSYEASEKLGLSIRTVHRLSVNGKEGQKGRNMGITVLLIPKSI
jgi:group I intron endonuclease